MVGQTTSTTGTAQHETLYLSSPSLQQSTEATHVSGTETRLTSICCCCDCLPLFQLSGELPADYGAEDVEWRKKKVGVDTCADLILPLRVMVRQRLTPLLLCDVKTEHNLPVLSGRLIHEGWRRQFRLSPLRLLFPSSTMNVVLFPMVANFVSFVAVETLHFLYFHTSKCQPIYYTPTPKLKPAHTS